MSVRINNSLNRPYNPQSEQEKIAKIAGGISSIVLAGASAWSLSSYFKDCAALQKAKTFRDSIHPSNGWPEHIDYRVVNDLLPIAEKQVSLLEKKCARTRTIAILTFGLLASVATGFAGGMLGIAWLINASLAASVLFGSLGLFSLIWHGSDNYALPPHMQRKIAELQDI